MSSRTSHMIGSLVFAACVITTPNTFTFAQGPTNPPLDRFQLLPASPQPQDMIAEQQSAELAMKNFKQGQISSQQKRQLLLNHSNPTIREKAQLAAKRIPRQPLPSSPLPPELQALQQGAEQAVKNIDQGRLSLQQKRQLLLNHSNPSIRAKAQEAQRFRPRPMGSLDRSDSLAVISSLWSLLNPFSALDVYAQSPFTVTLTPSARFSASPAAALSLHGCSAAGSAMFPKVTCANSSISALGYASAKPFVTVSVTIPRTGWYLLDFYGTGKPKATLRKAINFFQNTTLESWDTTASPTDWNHFATAEYLAQGYHTFFFSIDSSSLVFWEASIDEF